MAPPPVEPGPVRLCHWTECRANNRRYGIDLADISGVDAAQRKSRMVGFFAYHGTTNPSAVESVYRRGREATCEALSENGVTFIGQPAFDLLSHQRAWAFFCKRPLPKKLRRWLTFLDSPGI